MCLGSFILFFVSLNPSSFPSLSHANLCCTPTSHVGDGRPIDWSEWDRNLSSGQRDLPPFLPDVRVHVGRCLLTRAPGQRLCLCVALPRPADVPADPAHHLPPQAEEHHLLLFLGAWLQQRGGKLLHQHGDLQHLISEVHHLLAVYMKEDMPSRRPGTCLNACNDWKSMHRTEASRGATTHYDILTFVSSMALPSIHVPSNPTALVSLSFHAIRTGMEDL